MSRRLARRAGQEPADRPDRADRGAATDPRTARRLDLTPPPEACPVVLHLPPEDDGTLRTALALLPVVVVDLRARVERGKPEAALSAVHVRMWEARHGRIPRGAAVLLLTGTAPHTGPDCDRPAPGLTAEAATWLVTRRGALVVGTDACAPDSPYAAEGTTTQAVLRAGGAVLHHVGARLADLRAQGDWMCVPTGVPARLTAFTAASRATR